MDWLGKPRSFWVALWGSLSGVWLVLVLGGLIFGASLMSCSPVLALSVKEEYASDVASSSATLLAQVNAESAISYRFEYGIGESYGARVPEPEGKTEAGTSVVEEHLQSLKPNTTYHFRIVVSEGMTIERGGGKTFTTRSSSGPRRCRTTEHGNLCLRQLRMAR